MNEKIVGIIAEYNPLHNGHKYQITYAKEQMHAEYCVVVMSGNFVQRGIPAIIDKQCRAQMAIAEGADLVFELPACFATGALDDFALGAISLLDSLGVISHLVFGSEAGNIHTISRISEAMLADETSFQIIRAAMKNGLSAEDAQKTKLSAIQDKVLFSACLDAINQPNNILGILYLNAITQLHSNIQPTTHTRLGQDYLDDSHGNMDLGNQFASATAIRKQIHSGGASAIQKISQYIPLESYQLLAKYFQENQPITENDCWNLLCKKLSDASIPLTDIRLVSPPIADRITRHWRQCKSWSQLVEQVSLTDISLARVNRCLIHILLDITNALVATFFDSEICCYAKLLATSESGDLLLNRIRDSAKIPIIPTDNSCELSLRASTQLNVDNTADRLYDSLRGKHV